MRAKEQSDRLPEQLSGEVIRKLRDAMSKAKDLERIKYGSSGTNTGLSGTEYVLVRRSTLEALVDNYERRDNG